MMFDPEHEKCIGTLQEVETSALREGSKMETLQAQSQDGCVESTPKAEAYSNVRHQLQATRKLQKERYNEKIHYKQYQKGDSVWLYNPAAPQDQSKKLHHP